MGWFAKKFERFRALPPRFMVIHVFAKFVFGMGLGVLLVIYVPQLNRQLLGWLLIVLSIIIAIPSLRLILRK